MQITDVHRRCRPRQHRRDLSDDQADPKVTAVGNDCVPCRVERDAERQMKLGCRCSAPIAREALHVVSIFPSTQGLYANARVDGSISETSIGSSAAVSLPRGYRDSADAVVPSSMESATAT